MRSHLDIFTAFLCLLYVIVPRRCEALIYSASGRVQHHSMWKRVTDSRAKHFTATNCAGSGARIITCQMACRRNNKEEKKIRNMVHARLHRQTGISRRDSVRQMKRQIVAANNEIFQSTVFTMTTDEDYPPYTEFDNVL